MGNYDFEEEFSNSDSDNDDFLRHEVGALSEACLLSTSAAGYFSDDNDDDDLELVRSIKERYGEPLSLKPLSSLPPIASDDDEDDFETLRAIQRRFSQYSGTGSGGGEVDAEETKTDSSIDKSVPGDAMGNESLNVHGIDAEQGPCDSAENQEVPSNTSSFPKAAQTFIEAIKKNRSCQKFIRSKLLHIEARMEEIKDLQKRVKTLRDFQVQCKKKIARALSQKQDARIQLISAPKQKANSKSTEKSSSAMCYGPLENLHVACYRTTLTKFPLSFHREKWSKEERENLEKGIIQQFQELLLQKSTDTLSTLQDPGCANGLDSIISTITNINITPEIILDFSRKVNWEQLTSMYCLRRSGAECEARWLNYENRLIIQDKWSPMEDKQLLLLIQQNGINKWNYIAEKLKTNRTPFQCLARYQRSLNASILKRDWSEDEDAQLRAAVESFGESNWQAVASALEGRTGTQCSNRWRKTLHPTRQRVGKWSDDEDKRLRVAVALFGHKSWHKIAQYVHGRTQAQCRERWVNVLDPSLNRGEWTGEEDLKLQEAIAEHGYCWSKVAVCVPMRTDNQCRRRWKRLFPHEVPLLQAARNIQKAALISNFVDRESERSALGPNDFVPFPIESSTNELGNDDVLEKGKKSSTSEKAGSKKSRKRARSSKVKMISDCGDEGSNDDDNLVINDMRRTSKFGSKKKKCSRSSDIATELKKKSKNTESEETGDIETWDMPVNIRPRRPRKAKSKALSLISDYSVLEGTDLDDTNSNTAACMSSSEENNDPKVLHDQSACCDSQLKISKDKEVEASNIDDMGRKQSSSKLQPEGSLTETTLEANNCVTLEFRTSSSYSTKTRCVEAFSSSNRRISKSQRKQSKFPYNQTEEWEDLPLAAVFPEAVTHLLRRKSSVSSSPPVCVLN